MLAGLAPAGISLHGDRNPLGCRATTDQVYKASRSHTQLTGEGRVAGARDPPQPHHRLAAVARRVRLNQAQLADDLGVSRIPVRDALHTLGGEGLVTLNGRAGASVARMSIADLQELYELRGAIEPLASRLAVPNLGRAHLLRMEQLQATMESTSDELPWLEANTAFHATLYERSNRPRMIRSIETLRRQTDRYLRLHLAMVGHSEAMHAEHRRVLDAARRGDAPAVEALIRAHLETAHEFILRYLLEREITDAQLTFPSRGDHS